MVDVTIKYNSIQAIGYVSCKVPDDVFVVVKQEVQEIIDSKFKNAIPFNDKLAGNIEHEFGLINCADILDKFFNLVIPEYWKLQGDFEESKNKYHIRKKPIKNEPEIWVNIQKKYEINPMHNHGGILSFVLFLKIPYDLKEERSLPHVRNSNFSLGPYFSFFYPALPEHSDLHKFGHRFVGEHYISVDKNWEGTMIIFPAWMQHMVTPFYTSDEYRISVSGNLVPINNG